MNYKFTLSIIDNIVFTLYAIKSTYLIATFTLGYYANNGLAIDRGELDVTRHLVNAVELLTYEISFLVTISIILTLLKKYFTDFYLMYRNLMIVTTVVLSVFLISGCIKYIVRIL